MFIMNENGFYRKYVRIVATCPSNLSSRMKRGNLVDKQIATPHNKLP